MQRHMHIAQEMSVILGLIQPLLDREKCVFPKCLAVAPGGCWLALCEINYKEGASSKTFL